MSQRPDLPTVTEETGEVEGRMKAKDENGQTELHRLAGQEGILWTQAITKNMFI